MNKNEIIKEIEWRIEDQKSTYDFWMKKLDELPDEETAKRKIKRMFSDARERAMNGELYAFTEAMEFKKKYEEEPENAHYNVFLAMVRYDILERLLNTIKESEKQ